VRLIQKFNRQHSTIIGTEREKECLELHSLDTTIPKFASGDACLKYMFLYFVGLLPFAKIDHHEVLAVPYMTRDYLRMKLIEAREKSVKYYIFIVVTILANMTADGMIRHMNKRGLFTNLWVINDDDEIAHVARTTSARGIMSDRPTAAKKVILNL
jgi:glycerophosphoryl diester phosphodiesterase